MTRTAEDLNRARAYDRRRHRLIREGRWQTRVPTGDVRQHLVLLAAAGMSLKAVARAAHVSPRTMWPIAHDNPNQYVQGATASAILAVHPPARPPLPAGMVDATGTARRLQSLAAIGYSILDLSRRLGHRNNQQVWEWARCRQSAVTTATVAKVAALYEQLSGTPGQSTRARNHAHRNEWLPPLAWEDVDIDDPAALPDLGGPGDDIVDEVAIQRVLAGELSFRALREVEKVALFRDHLADWTFNPIMSLLGVSARTVKVWRARAAEAEQVAA